MISTKDEEKEVSKVEYRDKLEWKIKWDDISHLSNAAVFKSAICKTNGYTWQLELFPDGLSPDQKGYLSVYLTSWNVSTVQASCRFSLCNQDLEKPMFQAFEQHLFTNRCMSWGFHKYLCRESVPGLLENGELRILCEIVVHEIDRVVSHPTCSECEEKAQELDSYENLLNNSLFSDVQFNVQGTKIYAHKVFLASKSQVFADLFRRGNNKMQVINVEGISSDVFMEMLRFVYAAKVNGIKNLAEPLLRAATLYNLDKLVRMCEKTILSAVTVDNVMFYLEIAYQTNASYLKWGIYKFLLNNQLEIEDKPEFQAFAKVYPNFSQDFKQYIN